MKPEVLLSEGNGDREGCKDPSENSGQLFQSGGTDEFLGTATRGQRDCTQLLSGFLGGWGKGTKAESLL